jgi:hypothetical protein
MMPSRPSRQERPARCSSGRNLKNLVIENSNVAGSPLSRLAPARKSAQIISRQWLRDLSVPIMRAALSIARSMTGIWLWSSLKEIISHGSVSRPVSSFSTSFLLKLLLGHFPRPMQPGCTIEVLPVPPGQFGQLQPVEGSAA